MNGRAGLAVAVSAAALTSAYWSTMSSRSQLLGAFPYWAEPEAGPHARTVALTFDDGPNEPFTTDLAGILGRYRVPATFFQVGRAVERFPETSRALLDAGHVIGNHSYSHELHRCFGARAVEEEIRRAEGAFGEVLGLRPRLYRPPWLARTAATLQVLRAHRLQPVSGTFCHPLEVARCSARRIAVRAVARTRPGAMIIFHDGYNGQGADRRGSLDAAARTIDTLGEQGWTFTTVDRLLGVEPYEHSPARPVVVAGRDT